MAATQRTERTITATEARRTWSDVVNGVARTGERVVVEKSGVPVAAVISYQDLRRLHRFDAQWDRSTEAIERFSEAFKDVPVEELEREVAAALAEVRADARAETEAAQRVAVR